LYIAKRFGKAASRAGNGGLRFCVIAGLDPAIHLFSKMMDARVKPAHD
jgi:hypothetical protein